MYGKGRARSAGAEKGQGSTFLRERKVISYRVLMSLVYEREEWFMVCSSIFWAWWFLECRSGLSKSVVLSGRQAALQRGGQWFVSLQLQSICRLPQKRVEERDSFCACSLFPTGLFQQVDSPAMFIKLVHVPTQKCSQGLDGPPLCVSDARGRRVWHMSKDWSQALEQREDQFPRHTHTEAAWFCRQWLCQDTGSTTV